MDSEDEVEDDDIIFGVTQKRKENEGLKDSSKKPNITQQKGGKVVKPAVKRKEKKEKKGAKRQKGNSKLVKSLQEDEMEGNKLFVENIEIKDSYFYCKSCEKFSTTVQMHAKIHAIKCGRYKKMGRPGRISECLICSEKFLSIKEMH